MRLDLSLSLSLSLFFPPLPPLCFLSIVVFMSSRLSWARGLTVERADMTKLLGGFQPPSDTMLWGGGVGEGVD
jgi:hypothetical protein